MKKILAVVDALHFSEDALKSYKYLADKAGGTLTVLFLESTAGEITPYAAPELGAFDYATLAAESAKEREAKILHNKKRLQHFYRDQCMDVPVRELTGAPLPGVLDESRFADLLLVCNTKTSGESGRFLKDLLVAAQCPVMVLPENVHYIREMIFTYNGTFSSVFAIRQFTQLFEALRTVPATVVYIAENGERKIPSGKQLKDYLHHHYEEVTYQSVEGNAPAVLLAVAAQRTSGVITLGAYGRSGVSRFFRHSDAEAILRNAVIPVFITHP